jgi:hypothetical protein
MRLPVGGAPSYIVINECVLQHVITHGGKCGTGAREDELPDTGDPSADRSLGRLITV